MFENSKKNILPTCRYKREDGQRISEFAITNLPTVGQSVKRVISVCFGVVYKDEAWYVKEYKTQV